jgi:hypothetical protein
VPFRPPEHAGSRRWSEDRVRSELKSYLSAHESWPTRETFIRDGREQLRRAIYWFGGAGHWARQMGIPIDRRRDHGEPWTYLRMRREVASLVAGRTDWPTRSEFKAAGLAGLYEAISAKQVREQLARDLGLRLRPVPKPWTDQRIAAALDPLLEGRDTWPSWSEFRDAGLSNLDHALQQRRLRDTWAQRYGLPPPGPRSRTRWTDEAITALLGPFLHGRTTWPRYTEFQKAGLAHLDQAIYRRGTRQTWAERYGLRPALPSLSKSPLATGESTAP